MVRFPQQAFLMMPTCWPELNRDLLSSGPILNRSWSAAPAPNRAEDGLISGQVEIRERG